jgi:hypothetical protein
MKCKTTYGKKIKRIQSIIMPMPNIRKVCCSLVFLRILAMYLKTIHIKKTMIVIITPYFCNMESSCNINVSVLLDEGTNDEKISSAKKL